MFTNREIVTVGISPCWDITCRVKGIDWGSHETIDAQYSVPAGKALNVSRALAQLDIPSTATGLWGSDDYQQMLSTIAQLSENITPDFVAVPGSTRRNITIADTFNQREMHLRSPSTLANPESLDRLEQKLLSLASENKLFVFAGSLPTGELLERIATIIEKLHQAKAAVALDTSGPALRTLVEAGHVSIIKPNIEELSELTGAQLSDDPHQLIASTKPLLEEVDIVLLSRGAGGAIAITREGSVSGAFRGKAQPVTHTVGCGDYLLAGFLTGLTQVGESGFALQRGLLTATARAFGVKPTDLSLANQIELKVVK
ncbi:Tagatose-6-phosphate kinase [Anaerohalosphaera lusitana]|uniref:Tagatose-6-phosphate kinase n=1 Tax=Anaerohalosphaera lusitana TaxID=1936003 RepID=A0A1U9NHR8_9BACT|nr:PfkB family carbohydrate kinase [Anaerohalosphaera lusitana]AQT67317.1 Tagatose-6-phosphate kinase [Anaerohalosphaera lusitana]